MAMLIWGYGVLGERVSRRPSKHLGTHTHTHKAGIAHAAHLTSCCGLDKLWSWRGSDLVRTLSFGMIGLRNGAVVATLSVNVR